MIKTKPQTLIDDNKYCPGCGHGVINRLVAEVLEELGVADQTIGAVAVGCACLMIDTFGIDWIQAQHGRAAAVAAAIKRCRPDRTVLTYQGDGDALAIGFSETMYAAIRNENRTVIFVNNTNFGMTGGQMAPTTLPGQKTTTSPHGRDCAVTGNPLKAIDMLKTLDIAYAARGAVTTAAEIAKTKRYIRNAFEAQLNGEGYSFVEVLSPCPTNWGMTPLAAKERVATTIQEYYPVGEFVKRGEKRHD